MSTYTIRRLEEEESQDSNSNHIVRPYYLNVYGMEIATTLKKMKRRTLDPTQCARGKAKFQTIRKYLSCEAGRVHLDRDRTLKPDEDYNV